MFYLVYSFLYVLSLLPLRALYILSDIVAYIFNHVIHYRSAVIDRNLAVAFPMESKANLKKIKHEFYGRFCDNFIESIKLLSISEEALGKMFVSDNARLMDDLLEKGSNVTVLLGHFFNWEYANQCYPISIRHKVIVVYMPIKNKLFDRVFLKLRTRFNSNMLSAHTFTQDIRKYTKEPYSLVLVGDQNPGVVEKAYWLPFFGHLTPFVTGPEKSSRISNNAVVFCSIRRIKRGTYTSHLNIITEDARNTKKGEITKKMIQFIEAEVYHDPANYLWSHNRFKHEFKEEYRRNII